MSQPYPTSLAGCIGNFMAAPAEVHFGPLALAGPVDDLADEFQGKMDVWIEDRSRRAADAGYDRILSRLQSDVAGPASQMMDQIIATAQPKLQAALYKTFDDAQTQARLGATAEQTADAIKWGIAPVIIGGALLTAALTGFVTWTVITGSK